MILFKQIRYKNFLSSPNSWTTVDLDQHKYILILGENGSGKSTLLDALSFGLFGRPHRNINKPQLINSINKKDCLVEVFFNIGRASYKIVRGIKPTVFEIWKNGEMIDQSSHFKEYQRMLEQNILKLNHKTFHQIVVLGSSSFTPFMQLPAGQRREVIEDLLDINVFSKMNIILKDRISQLKSNMQKLEHKIDLNNTKISAQEKYLTDIASVNEKIIQEKNDKITNLVNLSDVLKEEIPKLTKKYNSDKLELDDKLYKLNSVKQVLSEKTTNVNVNMNNIVTDIKFYSSHDICPKCHQNIDTHIKNDSIEIAKNKGKILKSEYVKLQKHVKENKSEIDKISKLLEKLRNNLVEINSKSQDVFHFENQISQLRNEISNLEHQINNIEKSDLSKLKFEKQSLNDTKNEYINQYSYNTVMNELLKDTGIKTKVIKQYVPVINKLVNKYLQTLDFYILFQLDDSFNEEIRSRHRDIFSYDSFSEGEKTKIDLAMLFTWRQIAKMKNSVNTNLLILDETFDASLDYDSVDNLTNILYTQPDDSNIFIITHKLELTSKFENKMEFYKKNNFSYIKET